MRPPVLKAVVIILVVGGLVGGYLLIDRLGAKDLYLNMDLLVLRLRELKIAGPLLVIGLMTLAIGFITVIPFLFKGLWKNRNKDSKDR